MAHIAQDSLATIYFSLVWHGSHAKHVENYLAKDINFTSDILPLGVKGQALGLGEGDALTLTMDPSEVPPHKPGKVLDMPAPRFQPPLIHGRTIKARIGRYYPKNFIESVPGTRPDSATPFRVVDADKAGFKADMNHPLAGREVEIHARVVSISASEEEPGGLKRWPEIMLKGPGMQARLPETPSDFLGADPYHREDESDDAEFYATPRMATLLDSQAEGNVQKLYSQFLKDGMNVLDLMAGHISHMPEGLEATVTGLGLNMEEMEANPALSERTIHNLNEETTLPFEDATFDAVVCSLSVEYLLKPYEVFEEVSRILKPGGVFVASFSNLWFEEKVIRIWSELHEFERMGLISQYFVRTEAFSDITTWSERGWPQPDNPDEESNPIYAVSGIKK